MGVRAFVVRALRAKRLASMLCLALVGATDAGAQSSGVRGALAGAETSSDQADIDESRSIQGSLGTYGDPGGIRAFLHRKGIDYEFTIIGEVLGNASGGVKQGATYESAVDAHLDLDLHKLVGLDGAAVRVELLDVQGRGISGNNLRTVFTISGIEAYPSAKLYEAWYEQSVLDDRASLRVGQIAADTEFLVSRTASVFVDATFGWPTILQNDMRSGGPAYPLATPGLRLRLRPTDDLALMAAVFDGDPAGPYRPGANAFLPEVRDLHGTSFRLQDAPLLITQASFSYDRIPHVAALPGQLQVGYFHDFGSIAVNGDTAGRGNGGFYGVLDQSIYHVPGEADRNAAVFLRAVGTPGDRNDIDLSIDGGLAFKGPTAWRPDDTLGLAFSYARASANAGETITLVRNGNIVTGSQALIEATYQIALRPGLTVQPDVQYIFDTGRRDVAGTNGGVIVAGLRASVHY